MRSVARNYDIFECFTRTNGSLFSFVEQFLEKGKYFTFTRNTLDNLKKKETVPKISSIDD